MCAVGAKLTVQFLSQQGMGCERDCDRCCLVCMSSMQVAFKYILAGFLTARIWEVIANGLVILQLKEFKNF